MTFNMMFTLFLCFLLLVVRTDQRFAGKRLILGILIVFASGLCDWPVLAPLFTLLFWNAGEDWEARKKACWYVVILYAVFTFVSVCGLLLSPVEALIHTCLLYTSDVYKRQCFRNASQSKNGAVFRLEYFNVEQKQKRCPPQV